MVKTDLTRDYYGDLELPPNADTADIKKQFKKLALIYHPDRNPGRENEVTAKFQKIQSAHEVLIDPNERAKYDSNRVRGTSSSFRNAYGGQASGMKGNPWANAGSQWAPPPKPPTARNRAHPPPPSTGAGRYAKFTPPNTSAYQTSQEGPEARKAQYEAWHRTRHETDQSPGKQGKAPQPPPRKTTASGYDESDTQSHAPPRPQPNFQGFRESSHGRSASTNASSRKGFMPNTPGGDEPPAPRGAYSTQRDKPSVAPDPPPRQPAPEMSESARSSTGRPDPLKRFRMEPTMEERVSTPYATHGGEKFNPFESAAAGVNRSKSARERHEAFGKDGVSKAGSDTNLNSKAGTPHRARSSATPHTSHAPRPSFAESFEMDSSSDDPIQMPKPTVRPSRRSNGTTPRDTKQTESATNQEPQSTSKQTSRISQFRQWMRENPGQEPPPNGFGAEGPPLRSGQTTQKANEEPSMYATPAFSTFNQAFASSQASASNQTPTSTPRRSSSYSVKLETLAERIAKAQARNATYSPRNAEYQNPASATAEAPPSGVSTSPSTLNAFEEMQRSYVDHLLSNKRQASFETPFKTSNGQAPKTNAGSRPSVSIHNGSENWTKYWEVNEPASPSKKLKSQTPMLKSHPYDFQQKCNAFWSHLSAMKTKANQCDSSFSFHLNNETFAQTRPVKNNGFSNSAENIQTKFTPEDWDGKFAAGGNYFQPVKTPSTPQRTRSRSQSNSRVRGRSPVKLQPTFGIPAHSEEQTPIESPGGTKFSAQDWAETFKPQTFAPPQMPPPRGGPFRKKSIRPTMGGNAAVVDESDTPDERPLFTDHKGTSPQKSPPVPVSPEPMDVDTPPSNYTVPEFVAPKVNRKLNTEALKRPATSASTSPVDTELKVAFEDMKVKDIISTLDMPLPPTAPFPPTTENDIPTRPAYDDYVNRFEKYIQEWDRFNAKFLLHMVARKNQNDDLKEKRWVDDRGPETYRQGLKEDQAVMLKWAEHTGVHEAVVKCFVIMKERMKIGEASAEPTLPRKKTH